MKIIHISTEAFVFEGHAVNISTSLGIALFPFDDEDDAYSLVKKADAAMYHAKKCGKNNHQFYTAELWKIEIRRIILENSLKSALEQRRFTLVYQPRYELDQLTIAGVEALLRFHDEELGTVSPVEFIPVLESLRLINKVGDWVIKQACKQIRQWHDKGHRVIVSVNISARQLEQSGFVDSIQAAIQKYQIDAEYLELEITESALISESAQTRLSLKAVKALGLRIALDDFGSGYSSFNYLKQLCIDVLKIDRSFVEDIGKDTDSDVIIDAIINLANSLQLQVTAEGIETELQLNYLQSRLCQQGQGFYFAPPMPATDCEHLLLNQTSFSDKDGTRD